MGCLKVSEEYFTEIARSEFRFVYPEDDSVDVSFPESETLNAEHGTLNEYSYNAIGSVVALSDTSGVVTSTTDYEAFGSVAASTGSTQENRLFCTKERSASIGLDNFGFRYYDAELGRFITRDPAGYPDGPNNYLYCSNNPVNFIDPLGLTEVDISNEEAAKLKDISSHINAKVQGIIDNAIKEGKNPVDTVRNTLGKNKMKVDVLKGKVGPKKTGIENWVEGSGFAEDSRENRGDYLLEKKWKDTKYAGAEGEGVGLLAGTLLDESIANGMNLGGEAVGADKLGHFFEEGYVFYEIERKDGTKVAEKYFHQQELGYMGIEASGVYSKADLEANRQGGKFYSELQKAYENSTAGGGKGEFVFNFDINKYSGPKWNENKNKNIYEPVVKARIDYNHLKKINPNASPSDLRKLSGLDK